MLILPPGHAQDMGAGRSLRPREKWMLSGVGAALAVIVIAFVVSLATRTGPTGPGCVSVSLAYSTGGDHIYRCGSAARALCAGVGHSGGITGEPAKVVARACRRAGLSVG